MQGALLGAVTNNLYGACGEVDGKTVIVTWYVAAKMPDDERQTLQVAGTEVIADFPGDFDIDERFVEVRDPAIPLQTAGEWVLLQRGFLTTQG